MGAFTKLLIKALQRDLTEHLPKEYLVVNMHRNYYWLQEDHQNVHIRTLNDEKTQGRNLQLGKKPSVAHKSTLPIRPQNKGNAIAVCWTQRLHKGLVKQM